MNARMILSTLMTVVLVLAVVMSGAVIWAATAGTGWVARGEVASGLPRLVLAGLARALSLVL